MAVVVPSRGYCLAQTPKNKNSHGHRQPIGQSPVFRSLTMYQAAPGYLDARSFATSTAFSRLPVAHSVTAGAP